MYHVIDGRKMFVVEFDTMPNTAEEIWAVIMKAAPYAPYVLVGDEYMYAWILSAAIKDGHIFEPGSYGLAATNIDYDYVKVEKVSQ